MEGPARAWPLAPTKLAVLALTAFALALRLYRLEFQSLWWDEGISLYLARLDIPSLTTHKNFGIDLHPPLYHLLLAGWCQLAGSSVFAARLLSAVAGALIVPVVYYLGRRVFGPACGQIGALLLSVSPFHVFYSQEVRMYSLMPLLGLLSTVLALRILERRKARLGEWVALVAVNVAGLYTYYYLGLLVLAENLAFAAVLGLGWRRREARLAPAVGWLVAQAVTVLLYLPWLATLWRLFASGAATAVPPETAVHHSLLSYLKECLLAFGIGFARPAPWAGYVAWLTLALAVLGLVTRPKSKVGWWLIALGIAVALAGAYAVMLRRPFFYPRFIVYAAPLLYVLVGAGVARLLAAGGSPATRSVRALGPVLGLGGLVLLLGGDAQSLASHYTWPRTDYSSANYRVLLDTLAQHARPGDGVVGTYPWQVGYVAGYLPNAPLTLLYAPRASGAGDYWGWAAELLDRHPGVWLLLYSADGVRAADPIEHALATAAYPALADQFGDSRLRLFARTPPSPGAEAEARLGERVALVGYCLRPEGELRAGDSVDLTLVWQALAPVQESYTVFTHLLGPDGKVASQLDAPPLRGSRPTNTWGTGEVLIDRYRLPLPADAPPGEYLAEVGLYLPGTGERLPVGRSPDEIDRVIVGRFRVVR